METLSGEDLSGVRVHPNSSRPANLDALAYTQGQDIHVGPGQQKHLPHEGWHTVQQMQGRVNPTMQTKGESINDDPRLEREADVMGEKALQIGHRDQVTVRPVRGRTESVQKKEIVQLLDPLSVASLGLAVFVEGSSIATGGSFKSTTNTPSYMHENTPASAIWRDIDVPLELKAHHPRYGFDAQVFKFRLKYYSSTNTMDMTLGTLAFFN